MARRTKHPFGGGGGGCHTENAQFPAVLFVLLSSLLSPIQMMAGEILDLISLPLSGLPPSLMFRSPRPHKGNGRSTRTGGNGGANITCVDSSFKPVHLTKQQTPSGDGGKRVLSFFSRTEKSQKEQNQEWKAGVRYRSWVFRKRDPFATFAIAFSPPTRHHFGRVQSDLTGCTFSLYGRWAEIRKDEASGQHSRCTGARFD